MKRTFKNYIIFDFDYTISAEHLHGLCHYYLQHIAPHQFTHSIITGKEQIWDADEITLLWNYLEQMKALKTTGDVNSWLLIFKTLIDHDYRVAIASFSSFKPIIQKFLQEIIGLPPDYLQKIHIEAWLPEHPETANKNQHLDNILGIHTNQDRKKHYQHILLIDDSKTNIDAVKNLTGDSNNVLFVVGKNNATPALIMDRLSKQLQLKFPAKE